MRTWHPHKHHLYSDIPLNEVFHCIVGALVFAIAHYYYGNVQSLVVVLMVVTVKEIFDNHMDGHISIYNMMAMLFGGCIGFVCTTGVL